MNCVLYSAAVCPPELEAWLSEECALDEARALQLIDPEIAQLAEQIVASDDESRRLVDEAKRRLREGDAPDEGFARQLAASARPGPSRGPQASAALFISPASPSLTRAATA